MTGRRFGSTLLLALAIAAPLLATPEVDARLEPRSVTVGDRIAASVVVRLDADDLRSPRFPDWSRGWGKLTVLSAPPAERVETPAGVEWRQALELAAFEPGTLELPELEIGFDGVGREVETRVATPSGIAIEVRSVLPAAGEEVRPMPADAPRALPLSPAFWWTAAALAAVALGLLLARRRRAATAGPSGVPLPPLVELERALARLSGSEPEAALTALSLALRRFLGRTLALPFAESTTSEVAQRLAARALDRATAQRAVRLLRAVDQVKFARRPAEPAELAGRVEEALAVARDVERQLNPPAAVDPARTGSAERSAA